MTSDEVYELAAAKMLCEDDHLFFTKYFFKSRQAIQFITNWHHALIADSLQGVIDGRIKNLLVTVSPGSSKTEMVVINFIARGLALNPRARFLHLSGSDSLASLNSAAARELVRSDEYQRLWPMRIAEDADSKKRWNVVVDGKTAGGVYATALGGQVTGFRAGHMTEGFSGAILIDDPVKPEDAFSRVKLEAKNRILLTTVNSRKAHPHVPLVLIMQRVGLGDPADFVLNGNMGGEWTHVKIPAIINSDYAKKLPTIYQKMVNSKPSVEGRFSYWEYKEPIEKLLAMERGEGANLTGAKISRHVFNSQYNQDPVRLGGNIIHGEHFKRYKVLPPLKWRKIYVDTAQKTKERNDFSVFEEWGVGTDNQAYLLDLLRGKWEAPELQNRAIAFWSKCKNRNIEQFGQLRKMKVEDKSSGTGLIQTIKLPPHNIPIEGVERTKDKLTRVMDALPYIESGQVWIPEDAPFTSDFVAECEGFSADGTHEHDDQVDPMLDAIEEILSSGNKLKRWEQLGKKG